jgi:hypothetical protein
VIEEEKETAQPQDNGAEGESIAAPTGSKGTSDQIVIKP